MGLIIKDDEPKTIFSDLPKKVVVNQKQEIYFIIQQ